MDSNDKLRKQASDIDAAKDVALEDVNSRIDALGLSAYNIITSALESSFDFVQGHIIVGTGFLAQLNRFTNSILSAIGASPKFVGAVSSFVKKIPQIHEAIDKFQKEQGIEIGAQELAKNIVEQEYKNQVLRQGLNQHFLQPLRDLMFQDALGGITLKKAKANIRDYIRGGKDKSGKLGSYIQQTAQQAVDAYAGMISMKLVEKFKYDAYLMTGSLIDTSSPQCRYVIEKLNGIITRQNWPKVRDLADNHGLIEGTTFENLPVNQLHWGCRHGFYPIILKKAA